MSYYQTSFGNVTSLLHPFILAAVWSLFLIRGECVLSYTFVSSSEGRYHPRDPLASPLNPLLQASSILGLPFPHHLDHVAHGFLFDNRIPIGKGLQGG